MLIKGLDMDTDITDSLEHAQAIKEVDKEKAARLFTDIVRSYKSPDENVLDDEKDEIIKNQETAIMELGKLFSDLSRPDDLAELIRFTRPFLLEISKAKAAKLVRYLVDLFLDMAAGTGKEIPLCQECIDWAKTERRTFLRQALESRLITLYYETGQYQDGLQLVSTLLRELKKLDDKLLLVEVQLMESKIYYTLSNLPKARAALTSARTTANAIYVPPKLQAALDMQSGILHAADERDFKTAYSYFYESLEGYDSVNNSKAVSALKYMLLCKIMLNSAEEVPVIIGTKLALRYSGRQLDAMKRVAQASHDRSLAEFQKVLEEFKDVLQDDPIVHNHLETLYDNFLEQNLCRIIEPYSKVQISHIAHLIKLPQEDVEKKLSQMILDKKFDGILNQGEGVLIVYDERIVDKTYSESIDIIHEMNHVVDQLYKKAKKVA